MQKSLEMYARTFWRLMLSRNAVLTRGIRGGRDSREAAFDQLKDDSLNDWEAFDKMQEAEHEAIQQIENPKRTPKDFMAEERHQKKVLSKIIERRHFKKPQELNLLTWDAKEQIRYLHQEFPDEWTIDRLAESFPISREGVIKLVKSKWVPESIDRIIKHDQQVQERWLQLKSGKLESGGPLVSRYQQLLIEGKLHTLVRAAGHAKLPSPNVTANLPSGSSVKESGTFHALVKDYCDRKRQQQRDDPRQQLQIAVTENKKLLADVTKALKVSKSLNKNVMSSFSYVDKNVADQSDLIEERTPQTLLDVTMATRQQLNMHSSNSLKQSSLSRVSQKEKLSYSDEETKLYQPGRGEPVSGTDMEYVKKKKQILKEMKYDRSKNDEIPVEAYRFDHNLGYQHPLGRVISKSSYVHIRKSLRRENKDTLYRQGDSFYDETGEFLFRVPGMTDQQ